MQNPPVLNLVSAIDLHYECVTAQLHWTTQVLDMVAPAGLWFTLSTRHGYDME